MSKLTTVSIALASVVLIAACSSAPKKVDSLESAKSAYLKASSNETVVKHAAAELDDARSALNRAEKHWRNKDNKWRTDHYAYVASQKVKIAELVAQRHEDGTRLESMNLKRKEVQLDAKAQKVDLAREQTLALQQQLEDMQAQITARGIVATLGDVLFDSGEAGLRAEATLSIDKIASFMRQYPERQAIVEGHTDNLGNDDFNLDLSRHRAYSVRSALVTRGISGARISTISRGESAPIADNNTTTGRQQNRRVEVIFPDMNLQVSEFEAE